MKVSASLFVPPIKIFSSYTGLCSASVGLSYLV